MTQAEWQRVMGRNPSQFQDCGVRCPVENVNWFEVQQFIRQLNDKSQTGFRLPTEAEWEYACRAGGTEPFGSRSTLSSVDANINGNYPVPRARRARSADGRCRSVSSPRMPGACSTCPATCGSGPRTGPAPTRAAHRPIRSARCGSDTHVIRGGSWLFDGASARCGLRYTIVPQDRGYSLGVRLAHDVW